MRAFTLFKNIRIQRQLFSKLLLFFSLPILILGFLLVYGSYQKIYSHDQDIISHENLRTRSIMYDLTTNLYNISDRFVMNDDLHDLLVHTYSSDSECRSALDSYTLIDEIMKQETSIEDITIYTNNPTINNTDHFTFADDTIRKTDWYNELLKTRNAIWQSEKNDSNSLNPYSLCLYRMLPLPFENDFAILKISVSGSYLNNRLYNSFMPSVIAVDDACAFYSSGNLISDFKFPISDIGQSQFYQQSGTRKLNNINCITSISTLIPYRCDNDIYILTYSDSAYYELVHQTVLYALIVLIAWLIPCLSLYIYTKYFSARIRILRDAMHRASCGDYNIIDSYKGNDELSETFHDMKIVIKNIEKKEKDTYSAQLREQLLINKQQQLENHQQQIEYQILTGQINPHFLYNTLETIRMKAFNEDDYEVANAIKLLGKYLHYSLESIGVSITTLDRELFYMETYLSIQKLRFKDRVNYQTNIASCVDPSHIRILPFILQPIVENAVLHGLEGISCRGELSIDIDIQQDTLVIRVLDNGEGIDSEKLKALQKGLENPDTSSGKSIGLTNINKRIHLMYGKQYGVDINSQKGIGTTVTVTLPVLEC